MVLLKMTLIIYGMKDQKNKIMKKIFLTFIVVLVGIGVLNAQTIGKTKTEEFKAEFEKNRVVWENGAQAFVYTPERPKNCYGPEHDLLWLSEIHGWA